MSNFESIKNILINAGNLKKDEKVLILYDASTLNIAKAFNDEVKKVTSAFNLIQIPSYTQHGMEPPNTVANEMLMVDLVICLTKYSLAHSKARLRANDLGIRFLSLPDYSIRILKNKALLVNFKKYLSSVKKITEIFSKGKRAKIVTDIGTDLVIDLSSRKGNCCPGFVDENYKLGSPPDIEANIAPVEEGSNGIIVVDGSITCEEIGLLKKPITMEIINGKIKSFDGENEKDIKSLNNLFSSDNKKILAELGIGFNDAAELCGNMLIDEGAAGCIHFGFGSNVTIGGSNNVNFHLDFVIKSPTLYIDDNIIIENGSLTI